MLKAEFMLLALVCIPTPSRSPAIDNVNPFVRVLKRPVLTEVGIREYGEARIRIFEVHKNGTLVGYEFAFEGFPHKACIIPMLIQELKYDYDSYQCLYRQVTRIRGTFPLGNVNTTFTASFYHWGSAIYNIELPIEKEAAK